MYSSLLDLVRELNTLNDDNLADRVITNSDVQWCLSELQDILEAEQPTLTPPNEWVSVEDRLPEDEKAVLAYYGFNSGDGDLGMMFQGVLTYFSCDANPHWQHEGTGLTVTHWMPLPAPPGKEDQQ